MKIVCFGEMMMRLSPENYARFIQAPRFTATYSGAEANVAVSCVNYGLDAAFVTKMPANDIAQAGINGIRALGVDTSKIVRGGERLGIYFAEKGASQRGSKVIYDRKYSSIAAAERSDFNWDEIFADADWFHWTGITPALSDNAAAITLDACKAAKAKGITVSCDLNFRKNLWSKEKANEVMSELCKYVDVCIANEEDAEKVFNITSEGTDTETGKLNYEGYKDCAKQLADRFGMKYVAFTLRTSISAFDNDWAAMLYDGKECYYSKTYHLHIVDRIGGGDSFGGGLIYALSSGKSAQDSIEFAVAASALKHSIEGDFNLVSLDEVNNLLKTGGSGRVQR